MIAMFMQLSAICRRIIATDTGVLVLSAMALVALHTATNGQYGFHRDELATIDDARFLSWGYVVYPPITPFLARVSMTIFGVSMIGLRLFAALAVGIAMVLTGLMAREIGGRRPAQLVAAWASAIAGPAVSSGYLFQYVSFDYLCWVLAAWVTIRLLKSGDQRWWLALGSVIGFGMMTKFTMAFLVAGIVCGIVLDRPRSLLSKWLWCGAAFAFLIFLPNLIWQLRHNFITLDFLRFIHARDVRLGRADGFLLAQFWAVTNPVTVPIWIAGLYFLFFKPGGKRYRMLGWMYLIPLLILLFAQADPTISRRLTPCCLPSALFGASNGWKVCPQRLLSPYAGRLGEAWWSAVLRQPSWFCRWHRPVHAGGKSLTRRTKISMRNSAGAK